MPPSPETIPRHMPAWICRDYGGPEVLALQDRPVPLPGPGDVLIRVRATSVSSADMRVRSQRLPRGFGLMGRLAFGLRRPRQPVLGTDVAGIVVAVGSRATPWRPGDEVIGVTGAAMGGHAAYCRVSLKKPLARKPAHLTFEAAASLPFGGLTALHFLRRAKLLAGEHLLVLGAAGAVGSAFVQLARHQGAHVTAVTSASNETLLRSLGAERVIDRHQTDFTTLPERFDVIADTVGVSSFAACVLRLREHGRYLSVAGSLSDVLVRGSGTRRSMGGPAANRPQDLLELVRLADAGAYQPVIDGIYPFNQLPAAHARVETGRKRGSVIVSTCTPAAGR